MRKLIYSLFMFCFCLPALGQDAGFVLKVTGEPNAPLDNATVELLKNKNAALVKSSMTDTSGMVSFNKLAAGNYSFRISRIGYTTVTTTAHTLEAGKLLQLSYTLQPSNAALQNITVTARKPFIEMKADKTVVNLDASVTAIGTTALEALEKLPGIAVDKEGNISLKGKSGVLVLIDGKQTYLDPAQLAAMLGGMSSAQLNTVEIMSQPSSRYDAAGNAGIINIITKKNKQKGFNGSISTAYTQGFYPKNNNSLQLNYRHGKFNYFLSYSYNKAQNFTRIYALRSYFEKDGKTIATQLEQPSFMTSVGQGNNLRLGADYFMNTKTTLGVTLYGLMLNRKSTGLNHAYWMGADRVTDSLIITQNKNSNRFKNAGGNINLRYQLADKKELTADVDVLGYSLNGNQYNENSLTFPGTYTEALKATIPSSIHIISAKTDYAQQIQKTKIEGGYKTSHITTDNLADYQYLDGNTWKPDLGKSNHFLYAENIHAVYANAQTTTEQLTMQAGLRYEFTNYDAHQLGNAQRKDSSFSRSYNSIFPTLFVSLKSDSSNTFNLSAGRRIDRPVFQKLNPFVFVINKYTYQQGNPFYRPQYTWNFELSHMYKQTLTTGISYSIIKDYMSQIFPLDTLTGIVTYTEGNLGHLRNMGASVSVQLSPAKWWNMNAQVMVNSKKLEGQLWKFYSRSITQYTFNMLHQLKMNKGWSGELSGNYTSRAQVDILEILDPSGQVSMGLSKNILKNKATIKLAMRDVFYTQWLKGNTFFEGAHEYFKLTRDSRAATLSFTYRFGKAIKTTKRSSGAAGEEMQRVSNG